MLLHTFPALVTPFPDLITPLPMILFVTEEITGHTIEAAKSANIAPRNLYSCFYFMFYYFSNTIN